MTDDFENKLAGVCLALLCAMGGEARELVTEALMTFARDRNTPLSEAKFYRDLAESIEMPSRPHAWSVFEHLATVH